MRIRDVMSPCPYFVEASASLDSILQKMSLQGIRHLPVVDKGTLVGVLSERDVRLSQFVCKTTNYCPLAGEICVGDPYSVREDTDVADVALHMADQKLDYALVHDASETIIGIFTTIDACRLVHLTLRDKKSLQS